MPVCDHCMIEFPERSAVRAEVGGAGKVFCCPGCMGVYSFIRGEGFGSYYDKRHWDETGPPESAFKSDDDELDYKVRPSASDGIVETDFYVEGIRCASCVWLLEKVLAKTPGVEYARINYATHRAKVRWSESESGVSSILSRIRKAGYAPKPYSETESSASRKAEARDLLVRLGTSAFLAMNLMGFTTALYAGYFQGMSDPLRRLLELLATAIAIPAVFYCGYPILKSAGASIRGLRFNMDVLIAVGALSSFFYSVYGMFVGGGVYYDSAAMIVTFILAGRYIELTAKTKATETVRRLAELAPRRAVLLLKSETGVERKTVPVGAVKLGDVVAVAPGAKFPIDGVVLVGESRADESLVTGESKPVFKSRGSFVIGGSINLTGALEIEATRTGDDTALAGIMRAVEEAQDRKPPIQGIADKIVGVFVPAVIILAVATGIGYIAFGSSTEKAFMTALSVVVIACPCSLGLATPIAMLVFVSAALKRGILIRTPETVETAASVTRVVFDKTGTLTAGKPEVVEVVKFNPTDDVKALLGMAASVEARSNHLIAGAIVKAADDADPSRVELAVADFRETPGKGVEGRVAEKTIYVGSAEFLDGKGIAVSHVESAGRTAVFVGWAGEARAAIFISDALRPDAAAAVVELKRMGIAVSLVSGDNEGAVSSSAKLAGIDEHRSGVAPEGKKDYIAAVGGRVMMIGDGVNDAPALTEAAVGVAMAKGADVSMESADAVLTGNDLTSVPSLIRLAKVANRIVRQNVFWAFFYNIMAVPVAMAGLLHPILAAGAMAASSLVVVINSLRIGRIGAVRER